MRSTITLLLVLACPALPAQDVNPRELPPEQLWSRLERCQSELGEAVEDGGEPSDRDFERARQLFTLRWLCAAFATELARRGTESDREELWRAFDEPKTSADVRAGIVRGMLDARLEQVAADPAPVVAAAPAGSPDPLVAPIPARHAEQARYLEEQEEPAWFAGGPAELQEAWRLATSVTRAYWRATLSLTGDEPASYLAEDGAFLDAVAEYLRGRVAPSEALARIGRFEWGSWCGTGAAPFLEARDRALLLVLLDLRRTDLAAGALLAVADGAQASSSVLDADTATWPRLAERMGLDWERAAIGSLLDGDLAAGARVAVHGSEVGARLLLEALDLKQPRGGRDVTLGDGERTLALVAALVRPGQGCDLDSTSSADLGRVADDLPGDVQLQALEALAARSSDDSGLELASEAARQLHRLCRSESQAALEAMARSRFAAVREHAAAALHALGAAEVPNRPSPPVVFLVRVDGAPWQGALESTVVRTDRVTGEVRPTDARGRLRLDRDPFVDPTAPVRSILLETPRLEGLADTWFAVQLPAPRDLATVTEVPVDTERVTVLLPARHAGRCASESCLVRLEADTPPSAAFDQADAADAASEYRFFRVISESRPLRAGQRWVVRLDRARGYRAVVESASGSWTSPVLVPHAGPVRLLLRGDLSPPLEEPALASVEAEVELP